MVSSVSAQPNFDNRVPSSNMINRSLGSDIEIDSNCAGHCIVLTFRRIAVPPTAFAILFGRISFTSRAPWPCVFESWHAGWQKWVVLAERTIPMEELSTYRVVHIDTELNCLPAGMWRRRI
jgi:hypothetical protein